MLKNKKYIMNPKTKAESLRQEMYSFIAIENGIQCVLRAKFCAIIACKNTIKELNSISKFATDDKFEFKKKFWSEVLIELEKL